MEALLQNLIDAGCDRGLAEEVIRLLNGYKTNDALALLAKHRKRVLDCCHAEQKKIDCLDYLVYMLKKEKN